MDIERLPAIDLESDHLKTDSQLAAHNWKAHYHYESTLLPFPPISTQISNS
jgi:hypothetical protein